MKVFLTILMIAAIIVLGLMTIYVIATCKLYSKRSKLLESSIEFDPELEKTINESYVRLYGNQVNVSDSLEKKKALLLKANMKGVPPVLILLVVVITGCILSLILI